MGGRHSPEAIIAAVAMAARVARSNLEYDLTSGRRGDRDNHVQRQLCSLTGAEAATVVNNNAAAVLYMVLEHAGFSQGGAGVARRVD